MTSGWSWSASAPISAVSRSPMRALTTASSAPATVRSTTPRAASVRDPRRATCRCRPTHSFPTPKSRSAKGSDISPRPPFPVASFYFLRIASMSGPSDFQPTNPALKWIERRLPIMGLMHSSFVAYPTPRNLNYWWTFGAILSMMLGVQILTGVILAMHYTPHADLAFKSVELIVRDVNYGWLLRNMHACGASMFFFAVYVHMFRGLYYGSYKEPREVLWILGVIIYLLMMATGFMGYVLPWGQMSFWGATVITNLFSAIPYVGDSIVTLLWGGYSVGNPTLNRFFSLHYLLPFVIAGVVVLHVWALHVAGQNNPAGIELKSDKDTVPFTPYATIKDGFFMAVFCILFAWFVFYIPGYLLNGDNFIPANPAVTPSEIVPEWYYLPFYAILRSIPNKLLGVCALFGSIGILAFLPWLDTSPVRSARYRPLYRQFFCLIILPLLGIFEKTRPLPNSISESVLGAKA